MMQKNTKNKLRICCAAFLAPLLIAFAATPVFAADCIDTGILPDAWGCEDGLKVMIIDIINILSILVWILGGIFMTICGFMWMTATDDPGKVANAKKRMLEIAIAMLVFLALDLIAWWLGIAD